MTRLSYISVMILSALTFSASARMCVIGSDRLPIRSLSKTQLASLYQGTPVDNLTPLDRSENSSVYTDFYQRVLGLTPAQVNSYWSGQVFGGGGDAPQQVASTSEAIAYVRNNTGVVAYVNVPAGGLAGVRDLYCYGPGATPEISSHRSIPKSKHKDVSVTPEVKAKKQVKQHHAQAHQKTSSKKLKSSKKKSDVAATSTSPNFASSAISKLVSGHEVGSMASVDAIKPKAAPKSEVVKHKPDQSKKAAPAPSSQSGGALHDIASSIDQLSINDLINHKATKSASSQPTSVIPVKNNKALNSQAKQIQPTADNSHSTLIWPALVQHFGMDDSTNNPRVRAEVTWYLDHKGVLNAALNHSKLYLYYVYHQTRAKDLPSELALLPIVESNYDPYAYSSAGATGLWQMMPGTAVSYSLKINWWYDGLSDTRTSTNAALNYLKHIHKSFHSWPLTLAAYNAGYGTVRKAMARGKSSNYWSLQFPRSETGRYVPKLLALANIIQHAKQYGVKLPAISDTPYVTPIKMTSQIELVKAAKLAGITPKLLRALNPGFKRFATQPTGSYELLIPVTHTKKFLRNLKKISKIEQRTWIYHEARANETLQSIAKIYHTSVALLRGVNGLKSDHLSLDQGVLVPLSLHKHITPGSAPVSAAASQMFEDQLPVAREITIKVEKGDSLLSLATKYNVTQEQIRLWNHLKASDQLSKGESLNIWLIGSDDATTFGHEADNQSSDDQQLDKTLEQIYKN